MSDALKDRLSSHSNAFEGLLSLIPAKYYYDDDLKNQWNKKKSTKAEAQQAKRAKLDPETGSSALTEAQRRAQVETEATLNDSDDSEFAVLFDDNGNEVLSSSDLTRRASDSAEDQPVMPAKPNAKANPSAKKLPPIAKPLSQSRKMAELPSLQSAGGNEAGSSNGVGQFGDSNGIATEGLGSNEGSHNEKHSDAKKRKGQPLRESPGIEELRQKLADKINEMRAQRRAPGTSANGAPRSREELLLARKQREEQRKQKLKRKREDQAQDDADSSEGPIPAGVSEDPTESTKGGDGSVIYGGVYFKDGERLGNDLSLAEHKKLKKRSAADQLRVLQNRKAKLAELSESKQADIGEKSNWSSAVLRSEGAKLRDDEKMLLKTVKQQKKRKLKSEREWKERKDNVADGIASREARRNANLQARKDQKFDKKKGKPKKKRAGFEGKRRPARR